VQTAGATKLRANDDVRGDAPRIRSDSQSSVQYNGVMEECELSNGVLVFHSRVHTGSSSTPSLAHCECWWIRCECLCPVASAKPQMRLELRVRDVTLDHSASIKHGFGLGYGIGVDAMMLLEATALSFGTIRCHRELAVTSRGSATSAQLRILGSPCRKCNLMCELPDATNQSSFCHVTACHWC
jgi:hypothetical protein